MADAFLQRLGNNVAISVPDDERRPYCVETKCPFHRIWKGPDIGRREFVRVQRAQRDERRRRVAADRARRMGGADMRSNVQDRDADLLLIAIDAVPETTLGATKPSRPRRRAEAVEVAEPNVLTMAADNGDAAQTDEI
jgi:hypothetical protein